MITAVDTSVLIDVFRNDPQFGTVSAEALRQCMREGRMVVCEVVLAELSAVFPSTQSLVENLEHISLEYLPAEEETAIIAGEMWRKYRAQGGDRIRIIADFLIAAHAQHQCNRLLTRDRGFYRKYFKRLQVIDPSS